jgi:Na+-transporting NADH:ubiquinone oxidoreductase subunit D
VGIAFIREFFGKGAIFGFKIIGSTSEYLLDTTAISWLKWYMPNGLMVLPASAIFLVGIIIWIQRAKNRKLIDVS